MLIRCVPPLVRSIGADRRNAREHEARMAGLMRLTIEKLARHKDEKLALQKAERLEPDD